MAKMSREPLGDDDVQVGNDDPGGPVELRRLSDGRAVLLPRLSTGARLGGDGLEVLADAQQVVRDMRKLRATLDRLVAEAREYGVPWSLIGFTVGTSGEAARQKWSE